MQYYTFPTSCAIQILGNFGCRPEANADDLRIAHRLTMVVIGVENEDTWKEAFAKMGLKKIGTFNKAHSGGERLSLWVAGSDFKLEPQAPIKENK